MALTVLNVAYPLAPVSFDATGGAEQVVAQLDAALVAAGHRSLVIACEGSRVRGTLLATPATGGTLHNDAQAKARARHREAIRATLARETIDVVHLHGIDFPDYLPPPGVPVLVTLHLPPEWYPAQALTTSRPETYFHCVSDSQVHGCPAGMCLLPAIPNGVPVEDLCGGDIDVVVEKGRFVLSLGRICPEKGYHLALDAAARAGVPMLLAGHVYDYPAHRDYFRDFIQPRLDATRRFIGPVGFAEKRNLLTRARALLVPSLAPETSSLVAMEALACGTPVIASSAGALPDIVEHGRTGFIADEVEAMAEALAMIDQINPENCRAAARARFSVTRTNALYLERYRQLAASARCVLADHTTPTIKAASSLNSVCHLISDKLVGYSGLGPIPGPTLARGMINSPGDGRNEAREGLTVDTVTTWSEFAALRPEWTALWHACESATPFQAPEWLIPWARRWAADSLHVLTVRRGGSLVGLAPFFIYAAGDPTTSSGRVDEVVGAPVRTVVFLGNGLSDTLDLLAAHGHEQAVASEVVAALDEQPDAWDSCDWQQLRPESPLLRQAALSAERDIIEPQDACPTVALPVARPAEDMLSPHFAQRLQADFLRLARLGEVRFEQATAENFNAHFDSLIQLHAARWSSRNEPGVLANPAVQAFHREAAAGLLARGSLRFFRLLVGSRVAAVYYGFHHGDRASYYLGGFDPALSACGVGNQIVWHAIRRAQLEGARSFDFLRGREAYKYRWGAVDVPAFRRRFVRASGTTKTTTTATKAATATAP